MSLGARLYEEGLLANYKCERTRITNLEQREANLEADNFAKKLSMKQSNISYHRLWGKTALSNLKCTQDLPDEPLLNSMSPIKYNSIG